MLSEKVSDYFEGVAAKYLSSVDADPEKSNQHEIGGLPSVGFKKYLGAPGKDEEYRFKAKQVYLTDESETPVLVEEDVTWYDCRRKQPHRSSEYRLYYTRTSVSELLKEGDFFLIAKMKDGGVLMVFAPPESTVESQLRAVFGLGSVGEQFKAGSVDNFKLSLPLRLMFEELGVETGIAESDDSYWLERLVQSFGGDKFPTTSEFSRFSRETVRAEIDPIGNPDRSLLAWMEHEENLFRIYERHLVKKKLKEGFGADGEDVDAFVSFSLSVQNRRKSRVGHAFEKCLYEIFKANGLCFEQGGGKGFVTENNSKPDFIFPGFDAYKNIAYPTEKIYMLGAKTTCKDRWRQVLSEADRVKNKHLATLEPAISSKQICEMQSHGLQLVVPSEIHKTYTSFHAAWLKTIAEFIDVIKFSQRC